MATGQQGGGAPARASELRSIRVTSHLETWRKAVRHALTLVGAGVLIVLVVASRGDDIHTYWSVNAAHPYQDLVGEPAAFLYSPVAALVALPLHLLPFGAARILFIGLDMACLVYLAGPWALALVALYPVTQEISFGNIELLMAAAIVLGFRYPVAWSFILLTKVTPGVGLLWFAVRREWSRLAMALGATAALAVVSAVLEPAWWPAWAATLLASAGHGVSGVDLLPAPLAVRLLGAAALVVWGARTDRRWVVPVAATLAVPVVWWATPSMLIAVVPLVRPRVHETLARGQPPG